LGFDIEDQKFDDFSGVYNVEYFTNSDLIEIPRNIKPKKYTIVHKESKDLIDIEEVVEEIKETSSNLLEYFSKDDTSDVIAKDIIVGENIKDESTDLKDKKIDDNNNNSRQEVDTVGSEEVIIELLED